MNVGVDEPGHDKCAARVHLLAPAIGPKTRHESVGDRDVRVDPFAREHREHLAAGEHEVGGLVASCHRQPPRDH